MLSHLFLQTDSPLTSQQWSKFQVFLSYCESSAHSSDTSLHCHFPFMFCYCIWSCVYGTQCSVLVPSKPRAASHTISVFQRHHQEQSSFRQEWTRIENVGSYILSLFACAFLHSFTTSEESLLFTVEIIKIVRMSCNIQKLVATLLCFIKKVL